MTLDDTLAAINEMHDSQIQRATEGHTVYGAKWQERGAQGNMQELLAEIDDAANYLAWLRKHIKDRIEDIVMTKGKEHGDCL